MENGESGFCNNSNNGSRTHNISNNSNLSWDIWELGTSRFDWTNSFNEDTTTTTTTTANALMFSHPSNNNAHHHHHASLYGGGTHMHPDPHLTCLKLGKRHYFEDGTPFEERHLAGFQIGRKRGRLYTGGGTGGDSGGFLPSSSSSAVMRVGPVVAVPRCQVEGCHVALVNAKDYHRRHKVCEMHSKAPKVVVLGIEQRFCQQCSRFHVVSEFDDSKRSCRRRLAGHNERRRKSTSEPIAKNPSHETKSLGERFPCISGSTGRALSLLSSKTASWVSSADISSRSSAALRELIAENRAAVLSRQLFFDRDCHNIIMNDMGGTQPEILPHVSHQHQMFPEPSEWDRLREAGAHVTLDLMQASSPAFGFLSGRTKSKEEEEEECCELWKSLEGTHVV